MSDATLNEEIARLEIEIDAVRDALDEAIKRNEALEEEISEEDTCDWRVCPKLEAAEAALKTAREALLIVQANLLADDFPSTRAAVDAALASLEPSFDKNSG